MQEDTKLVDKRIPTKNLIEFWEDKLADRGFMNPSTQALVKDTIRALKELDASKKIVGGT